MTAPPAEVTERVVVVLGPSTDRIDAALDAAGLKPVIRTAQAAVCAPPLPPAPVGPPPVAPPVAPAAHVLLTIEEAARRLAIGRSSMYGLISGGQVRCVRIGRSARIPSADIDRVGGAVTPADPA